MKTSLYFSINPLAFAALVVFFLLFSCKDKEPDPIPTFSDKESITWYESTKPYVNDTVLNKPREPYHPSGWGGYPGSVTTGHGFRYNGLETFSMYWPADSINGLRAVDRPVGAWTEVHFQPRMIGEFQLISSKSLDSVGNHNYASLKVYRSIYNPKVNNFQKLVFDVIPNHPFNHFEVSRAAGHYQEEGDWDTWFTLKASAALASPDTNETLYIRDLNLNYALWAKL